MAKSGREKIEQALQWLRSDRTEDVERAIRALQSTVYSFGMKVCGHRYDAEDIAQETLIRLARSLKEFPNSRALAVWLYKVAKTQCLMSRRQSKFAPKQMLSLDALMPEPAEASGREGKTWMKTPEEATFNDECHRLLERAVLSLPKTYRLVLILRDMEQLDTREVAEVMGISENTARMRLHRARVFVRRELDACVHERGGRML